MRRVALWLPRIVGGLLVLLVAFFAVLGIRINRQLARKHVIADVTFAVPSDSASIARGQ